MSPKNVEKLSDDSSPVSGFVFHGEQGETQYRWEEVVWMFDPDPNDPFAGVGVVGPQAREFDAATFASSTVRSHFQHDATPKVVLKADTEADAPSAEARKLFGEDWQNRYNRRNGEHIGVPAFLPSGFDLHELSGMSNIEEIRSYLEFQRDGLLMANGVPRSILGDVVDANRAAADTNRLVFDRHTIAPQAGLIADALTHQIAVPEFGEDVRIRFEEFVSADEDLRLREEQQDVTLKVRSINHVREDRGLDSVDWGDSPVGSFADIPYTGEEREPLPNPFEAGDETEEEDDDAENGEDEEKDEGRAFATARVSRRIASRFTGEAEWSRVIQRDSLLVPRMLRAVRVVFAGQRGVTLENLDEIVRDLQGQRSYQRSDALDALFETTDFERLWRVHVDPVRRDAIILSGENVLGALEVQLPRLSFVDAAVKRMEENGAELVKYANETTKAGLRRTLIEGIADGDPQPKMIKRVRKVYSAAGKNRARAIARTETLSAIQSGQLLGYEESDVVSRKRWNTALDAAVRDSHQIGGQTRGVAESFILADGEPAKAPGVAEDGGRLSARNAINCRCFLTPVLEGD